MNPLGLHEPGTGPLHRAPAGPKFAGLLVLAVLLFALPAPLGPGVLVVLVLGGYALARIPLRRCGRLARVLVPLLAALFLLQWWLLGPVRAEVLVLRLLAALAAANLFTLTTKVEDLVAAVERGLRPLRRIGVKPERIGLLLGLTMQAIAALSAIATETREAQRARGAGRSVPAFAIPFLVRTLRHSDELGEALAARGVGED